MLRLTASRLVNRVAPVRLATAVPKRCLHAPPEFGMSLEEGLKPLFSPAAARLLRDYQIDLVNNVNRLTTGTEYENLALATIARKASKQPRHAAIFNNASQAWNMGFYLSSLHDQRTQMTQRLQAKVASRYQSLDSFYEDFENQAAAIFGSGWTWLVEDETGNLRIMNTYNAGSVLTPDRSDDVDTNTELDDPYSSAPLEPFYKTNYHVNTGTGTVRQGSSPTQASGEHIPLLAINMWEHAYLPDYKLNKRAYIRNFLQQVNWEKVDSRFSAV
ncbi:hypothetical protein IWQ60_010654 [Tieghemiomyces parasiticus]|uniref:Manganese/iron superoxide dismutase C-terminal domain-containing protein n=1 Tax=Tieghemiomyces parasiticus TaxID=78921 RepID=A0A9W8DMH2_9FUNG|nr:hypothetical protein IWQ60_010654 [Tieghemiomyces parasiticus]